MKAFRGVLLKIMDRYADAVYLESEENGLKVSKGRYVSLIMAEIKARMPSKIICGYSNVHPQSYRQAIDDTMKALGIEEGNYDR